MPPPILSIDLLLAILHTTLLHPILAWLLPLGQLAWTPAAPPRATLAWAALVTLCRVAAALNRRLARGLRRRADLADEVVVVTGGASGLGGLVAATLGLRGAAVAVLDVKGLEEPSRGVTFFRCDVGVKEEVFAAAARIETELGPPTMLINNAAIVTGKPLLDLSLAELDTSIATNLLGPLYCLKAFLPSIARAPRGGTVVTVSSVIGQLGAAQLSDYAASKGALIALHASLAAELRASHPLVRMVLLTPGQLSTPLFYGVRTPSAFLAPIVEPVDVVKELVATIDGGTGGSIAMPLYARWIDWYHVLPESLQLLARKLSGVDRGMRTFIGRKGYSKGLREGTVAKKHLE